MNPNSFENGKKSQEYTDEGKKELEKLLNWLKLERVHVPNILYGFQKIGWTFASHRELYLAAIKIGFYDVIKKLKESMGTEYTQDAIGHWGSHIGWEYIKEIKPYTDDKEILDLGDSLALLLARLYEINNNRQALDFYGGLGNTDKIKELEDKNSGSQDKYQWKGEKAKDDDPRWQKEISIFLSVAEKYNITEQEREHYINSIKTKVENEIDSRN